MKILFSVSLILILAVFHANAQYPVTNAPQNPSKNLQNPSSSEVSTSILNTDKKLKNHLTINSDKRINKLLEIRKEESLRKKGLDMVVGIDGYRVQIFQGTNSDADRIRSRFISKYPEYESQKLFPSPDFVVRVGNFRDRSEAIHLQYLIEKDFPNSLIVEDVIHFPVLKEENGTKGEL